MVQYIDKSALVFENPITETTDDRLLTHRSSVETSYSSFAEGFI